MTHDHGRDVVVTGGGGSGAAIALLLAIVLVLALIWLFFLGGMNMFTGEQTQQDGIEIQIPGGDGGNGGG